MSEIQGKKYYLREKYKYCTSLFVLQHYIICFYMLVRCNDCFLFLGYIVSLCSFLEFNFVYVLLFNLASRLYILIFILKYIGYIYALIIIYVKFKLVIFLYFIMRCLHPRQGIMYKNGKLEYNVLYS